jgi:hypothetical protein
LFSFQRQPFFTRKEQNEKNWKLVGIRLPGKEDGDGGCIEISRLENNMN